MTKILRPRSPLPVADHNLRWERGECFLYDENYPWMRGPGAIPRCTTVAQACAAGGFNDGTREVFPLFARRNSAEYTPTPYFGVYENGKLVGTTRKKPERRTLGEVFDWAARAVHEGELEVTGAGRMRRGAAAWMMFKICSAHPDPVPGPLPYFHFYLLVVAGVVYCSPRALVLPIGHVSGTTFITSSHILKDHGIRIYEKGERLALESQWEHVQEKIAHFLSDFQKIAKIPIGDADWNAYADAAIPGRSRGPRGAVRHHRETLDALFEKGRSTAPWRGSWAAAYVAICEYLDFSDLRGPETPLGRLESAWFDDRAARKGRGFKKALEHVDK